MLSGLFYITSLTGPFPIKRVRGYLLLLLPYIYIYIYIQVGRRSITSNQNLFGSTGSRKDAEMIGVVNLYVKSKSLTVQMICSPEAFRLPQKFSILKKK